MLVEGFRQAEMTHGVCYIHLIGDGDNSVLSYIHKRVPVWGRCVHKIECVQPCPEKLPSKAGGHSQRNRLTREQANSPRRQSDISQQ